MLNRSKQLFTSARRVAGAFTFYAVSCALLVVLAVGCSDGLVAADGAQVEALSTAAAAPMSARGSWNNWHVHDLPPGVAVYTEENGLTHRPFAIFARIFDDYATTPSLHAYCPDGVDKGLLGGGGGSKAASGTCQNEETLIHLKNQANGAPGPAGWTFLSVGLTHTVYYRLTSR